MFYIMLKEITVNEFLGLENLGELREKLPRTPYDGAEWLKITNINTDSFQLIDIREQYEYEEGNIENSINIPMSDVLENLNKLDQTKEIIFYCNTGRRSKPVAFMLYKLHNIPSYSLKGGYKNFLKIIAK